MPKKQKKRTPLYAYISQDNLKYIKKEADRHGLKISRYVDLVVNSARLHGLDVRTKKLLSSFPKDISSSTQT